MSRRRKKSRGHRGGGRSVSALDQMEAALRKNRKLDIGNIRSNLDTSSLEKSMPHLPTGSLCIDHLIGGQTNGKGIPPCPGFPRGKLSHLYSEDKFVRNTALFHAVKSAISAGGTVLCIDFTGDIDFTCAGTLHTPQDNSLFQVMSPDTLEEAFAILMTASATGVDLILINSLGSGTTKRPAPSVGLDGEKVGHVAAAWNWFLPVWKPRIFENGTAVVAFSRSSDAAGEAWKFYTSVRMNLTRLTHVDVGPSLVRATLDKCKVSRATGRSQDFYIAPGKGIDDVRSILETAIAEDAIKKDGDGYLWGGQEFQDVETLLGFLREDHDEYLAFFRMVSSCLPSGKLLSGAHVAGEPF